VEVVKKSGESGDADETSAKLEFRVIDFNALICGLPRLER
jgi:hypothetical protein